MHHRPQSSMIQIDTPLRQRRQLAPGQEGTIAAHPGQEVSTVQVVARAQIPAGITILDVSGEYGVPAQDLEKQMLVKPGASVHPGTPLAEKKRRFRKAQIIESPVDGSVEVVYEGRVFIRRRPVEQDIRSLMRGYVIYSIQNRGVSIETRGTRLSGLIGSPEEGFGQFKLLATTPSEKVKGDTILSAVQGAVVGLALLDDLEIVQKAAASGVRGFIVGTVSESIYRALPSLNIPFIVTDGVGIHGMALPIYEALGLAHGRELSLLAARHSFSPRPLIIFGTQNSGHGPIREEPPVLSAGRSVRLLRRPYQSVVGEVVAVYNFPHEISYFGAHTPSADVRLPSGDVIAVPAANLDIIM